MDNDRIASLTCSCLSFFFFFLSSSFQPALRIIGLSLCSQLSLARCSLYLNLLPLTLRVTLCLSLSHAFPNQGVHHLKCRLIANEQREGGNDSTCRSTKRGREKGQKGRRVEKQGSVYSRPESWVNSRCCLRSLSVTVGLTC